MKYELRRRPYMIDRGLRCIVYPTHVVRTTTIVRCDGRARSVARSRIDARDRCMRRAIARGAHAVTSPSAVDARCGGRGRGRGRRHAIGGARALVCGAAFGAVLATTRGRGCDAVRAASVVVASGGGTTGAASHRYGQRRVGGVSRAGMSSSSSSSSASEDAVAMAEYPKPIVVEPRESGGATRTVVMLHGLGDTGAGWASAAQQIRAPANTRWVFPTARTVPVTLNGGARMTAWFDLNALDAESIIDDETMINESVRYVEALVRQEMAKGVASDKIVIGGFSQGGVIALTAVLRSELKLAGCLALSTYLPLRDQYPAKFGPYARDVPILQGHGTNDMVLRYDYGKMSNDVLTSNGVKADFKTYTGMAHSACAEEFDDVADFLESVL